MEIYFLYTRSIDSLEIVLHGDDVVACFAPFGLATGSFSQVGMIAVGIVCWLRMPIADQGDA